ncbi:DUF1294 domain-containing protein [Microbulbifer sp. YPW1]|uniref:DUF1294 domain-containing protein n=1 Tax=Microbulbifer sp. YPW1 TaxID=2745199 RepID=UPI00159B3305|nr:DUF1294 domain-containing protein [Microbulbifer sp. YPW1]QKX16264.1 DUF1294 domain-containing protein [Microbulbifer sp. YPW1]
MAVQKSSNSLMLSLVFLGLVTGSAVIGLLPPIVALLYFAMSLLTYLMYYLDKSAARNGNWRTKESTLHLLSLLCGWPGALVAQQRLRHKTRKQPFRFIFWLTVLGNLGALAWMHTPEGTGFLSGLLGGYTDFPFH